jgi:hypothetical protein
MPHPSYGMNTRFSFVSIATLPSIAVVPLQLPFTPDSVMLDALVGALPL